ncbi:MAG TPA: hypothetical protein VK357_05240 [Rubrobacteraceae bacterium]|nr:hypothetical protein [Rubrobacteraceae bacterium]
MAAFEDMPLKQALVFLTFKRQDIEGLAEGLAWAFKNPNSAEEFEQRLKERKGAAERVGERKRVTGEKNNNRSYFISL